MQKAACGALLSLADNNVEYWILLMRYLFFNDKWRCGAHSPSNEKPSDAFVQIYAFGTFAHLALNEDNRITLGDDWCD